MNDSPGDPADGIRPSLGAGETFAGRFVVESEAGRGGMGRVYRAFDRIRECTVALKVLHHSDAQAVRRFGREADVLGKLDHPDIVRYLAHGVSDEGVPYLALEWIEGETLRVYLARTAERREHLAIAEVVELGQRLAGALAVAHAAGIVHRDVKPSNVLLAAGNLRRPKLLDFGIVRTKSAESVTASGTVVGTVGYMSPEQARGASDLDGRADLFSLGCVLFRSLTNRDVFDAPDPMTMLSLLLLHEPPRVATLRGDVSAELDALVAQLLEKDREKRPASASVVNAALMRIGAELLDATKTSERLLTPLEAAKNIPDEPPPRPSRAKSWRIIALFVAAAAVVTGTGFLLRRTRETPPVSPAAAAVAPKPVPTTLTDLSVAPTCTPEAAALHRQGLQAAHEGRWISAARIFEQALKADASCPQIYVRLLVVSDTSMPIPTQREYLRRIVTLRNGLNDRDQRLLRALTVRVVGDPPQDDEVDRILDDAVQRFPMDAELRLLLARRKEHTARSRADLESVLEHLREAIALDPAYADAWQIQSHVFHTLGQREDQIQSLNRCLEVAPGAVDCMHDRIQLFREEGQCGDAAAEARHWIGWEPDQTTPYAELAVALAAQGAPRAAIEETLHLGWNHLTPARRTLVPLEDGAALEAWAGNFRGVLNVTESMERAVAESPRLEARWRPSVLSARAYLEMGETARAGAIAERALSRKSAWVSSEPKAFIAADMEAFLLGAALRSGRMSAAQWRDASRAWESNHAALLDPFERWAMRWGNAIDSVIPASEMMENHPDAGLQQTGRPTTAEWYLGTLEAYAGHIYLYAGDAARAAPLLERGARVCRGLDNPLIDMPAHLWLGMAKEKLGDPAAACDAYRAVRNRWGHAIPASITAREAERRLRALDCR